MGRGTGRGYITFLTYLQAPPSPPHPMLARRMLERRSIVYLTNIEWGGGMGRGNGEGIYHIPYLCMLDM